MGFFDKVKNMFTEEVEEDVKVEQVKKEVTKVSIESPKVNEIDVDNSFEEEETISRTVFFDDNDFKDLNLTTKEEKTKYVEPEIYGSKLEEKKEEKKVFKPTPIISPVYGVLDKNYHKEDIVSRTEFKKVEKNVEPSIDSIRNKAYGTLEDELENTLFGNNSILFKKIKEEEKEEVLEKIDEDVLTDLTEDIGKELDELLDKKEKYLDKEDKEEITDDLFDFIDSTLYKDGDDNNDDWFK